MKRACTAIFVAVLALTAAVRADLFGTGPNQFTIDFVAIGSPGNADDDPVTIIPFGTMAFGAVDYTYRIGKYEVTIDQFMKARAADGRIGSGNENYWNDGTRTAGPNAPVSYVTWYESAMFCNWLTTGDAYTGVYQFNAGGTLTAVDRSYRNGSGLAYVLPTEDEWYKAAYFDAAGSGGYSLYANGADTAPLRGADGWNYSLGAGNYVNPAPNYTWETGSGGEEQNGTYDMMGNVFEWNESTADGSLDNLAEPRIQRGGAYSTLADYLGSPERSAPNPENEWNYRGFRVAAIPEPSSVLLLTLGSGCIIFYRRAKRRLMDQLVSRRNLV